MNRKLATLFIFSGIAMLAVLAIFLLLPARAVEAQCKNPSKCKYCHEVQAQKPVSTLGAWHTDHGVYDLCSVCHGGDREAITAEQAHVGMVKGLQDMPAACKSCHPADLETVFNQYAAALNVSGDTALQAAQSGSALQGAEQFFGQQAALVGGTSTSAEPAASTSQESQAKPVNTTGNLILGGMLAMVVVGGGSYVAWNERRLARTRGPRSGSWLVTMVRKEQWSPYAAGVLLGVVCILVVLLAQRTLGAASAISTISSTVVNKVAPGIAGQGMYFRFIMPPGFNWELALLIGVFFGGLIGAWSSGTLRLRWNDDPTWNKVFGKQRWKRLVIGFLGAILLQYGAGIAGGCTSGLAISGGMLLAPSAFIFMAGMFVSGILVALLVYRRRY